jgi:hypothetical protein
MSQVALKSLENAISGDCKDEPLVFVHQTAGYQTYRMITTTKGTSWEQSKKEERVFTKSFTLEDFMRVRRCPFSSRLDISGINVDVQAMCFCARFTDNSMYMAPTQKCETTSRRLC